MKNTRYICLLATVSNLKQTYYKLPDVSTNKIVVNIDVRVDGKIPFFSNNDKYIDTSL